MLCCHSENSYSGLTVTISPDPEYLDALNLKSGGYIVRLL